MPTTEATLARVPRQCCLAARAPRVRPGLDDKVLADWNGLMIAALAQAGLSFERPEWIALAARAFAFIAAQMTGPDGRLHHSWRARRGAPSRRASTITPISAAPPWRSTKPRPTSAYLGRAREWVAVLDRHHWDAAAGGYFFAADDTLDLIARAKTANDAAVPAGNGTMVGVLTRLALVDRRR